jgi:hypothetical protein
VCFILLLQADKEYTVAVSAVNISHMFYYTDTKEPSHVVKTVQLNPRMERNAKRL